MMWKTLICVTLCFIIHNYFIRAEDLIVNTLNGPVRGRMEYSMRKTGVPFYAFQQIPYGKAPVGDLRFKEPQPADSWTDVLDATKNTKLCYQVSNGFSIPNVESLETEDCLFLNIYTPQKPVHEKNLAVIIWIYGGGFICGTSNFEQAGPHYFMENGVMFITVSYRVGPFGFLATDDLSSPGNYGLKDQNLALQWIRKNIEYFGGDPNRVTIMGTSAGAASVTYQFMSPKSKGLFWAGIAGSGSLLVPWAYQKDAKDIAYKLAKTINPSFDTSSSTAELIAYLRSVPADVLNNASSKAVWDNIGNEEIIQGFFYAPVIEPEHDNAFITERMYKAVEKGKMAQVPLMIGIESEEALARTTDNNWSASLPGYDSDVKLLVNHNMRINDSKTLEEVGQKIRKIFTDGLLQNNLAAAIRYFSDMSFNRPIIRHGELQSKFSDVYFFQFSYDGKLGGKKKYIEGAEKIQHSEDNNYFWTYGNWSGLDTYPPEDVLTSERWRLLLTNFAKYSFVQELNDCLRWCFFIDFAIKSYSFSQFLYAFLKSANKMNIESVFHFAKVFVIIVENWYINYHANELIVTSKKLSSNIFSNGWYDLDESTKKSLMLMMIRSQRPLKIDIGTVYYLGTELFVKILKGGYSFIVFYYI